MARLPINAAIRNQTARKKSLARRIAHSQTENLSLSLSPSTQSLVVILFSDFYARIGGSMVKVVRIFQVFLQGDKATPNTNHDVGAPGEEGRRKNEKKSVKVLL